MSTIERAGEAIVGAGFPQWRGAVGAYEHGSGRSRKQKYHQIAWGAVLGDIFRSYRRVWETFL